MTTATERFIRDAVKNGEWMWSREKISHYEPASNTFVTKDGNTWIRPAVEVILLDPAAWQAVGEVRGWGETEIYDRLSGNAILIMYWRHLQYGLIDALADGKTIEEYLSSIE